MKLSNLRLLEFSPPGIFACVGELNLVFVARSPAILIVREKENYIRLLCTSTGTFQKSDYVLAFFVVLQLRIVILLTSKALQLSQYRVTR